MSRVFSGSVTIVIRVGFILALVLFIGNPLSPTPHLWASNRTVNGTSAASIGNGRNDSGTSGDPNIINITDNSRLSVSGQVNAISVGNYTDITIGNGAIVQNNASNSSSGKFGTGPNTIETNNYTNITVYGTVRSNGSATNGEAINVHGIGNTITVGPNGYLYSSKAAAIWFQDQTTTADTSIINTVINHGTIETGVNGGNVIGSSRGTEGPGINFENYGVVIGNLVFANGNDKLTFGPGSKVTGNIDGGGGNNTLILDANLDAYGISNGDILSGAVKGFNTITKTGTGMWIISGPLANFSGGVTVKEGTLGLWGNNTNFIGTIKIDNGATLDARTQSLPSTENSITNNGILRFNQNTDGTFYGSIQTSSAGTVEKLGTGTVTLANANNYLGQTWIREGAIAINNLAALGSSPTNIIEFGDGNSGLFPATNGTLQLNSNVAMDNTWKLNLQRGGGTIRTIGDVVATFKGTIKNSEPSKPGSLTKTGTGTLDLSEITTASYTGGTWIKEGTVIIDAASDLGTGGLQFGDTNTNGTLNIFADATLTNEDAGSIYLHRGGGTINVKSEKTATIESKISGSGALTKSGAGTLELITNSGNDYRGGTNITDGVLVIDDDSRLGAKEGPLNFYNNAALQLRKSLALDPIRRVILNAGGGTIDTNGKDGTVAGIINGPGGLTKIGDGTLTLTGVNTFDGGVTVKNGTLAVNSNAALGNDNGLLKLANNTTLKLIGELNSAARPVELLNDLSPTGDGVTINTNSYNAIFNGNISGQAINLDKQGDGILALHGNNNFVVGGSAGSGTIYVSQGTLAIDSNNALGHSKNMLDLAKNTTLRIDNNITNLTRTIAIKSISGESVYATIDTQGYKAYFRGETAGSYGLTGGGDLHKTGTGQLTLWGSPTNYNTFNGAIYVDEGTLQLLTNLYVDGTAANNHNLYVGSKGRLEGGNFLLDPSNPQLNSIGIINANVTNAGVIAPGESDGARWGALEINGDLIQTPGSTIEIAAILRDNAAIHSMLIIDGEVQGNTVGLIKVVNVRELGQGAMTQGNGIEIIRVLSGNLAGKFKLVPDVIDSKGEAAVIAGAYQYNLDSQRLSPYASQWGWYLYNGVRYAYPDLPPDHPRQVTTKLLNPAVPLYEAYPLALLGLNRTNTLEERVGHRIWNDYPADDQTKPDDSRGFWMRLDGLKGRYELNLASNNLPNDEASFRQNQTRMAFGFDFPILENDSQTRLEAGINASHLWSKTRVNSSAGNGQLDTTARQLGTSLTWYGPEGLYLDGQARFNWFSTDFNSREIISTHYQTTGASAVGQVYSLEAGWVRPLNEKWSLTPQAQISSSSLRMSDFIDAQNTLVSFQKENGLEGRLGLGLNYETSQKDSNGDISRTRVYGLVDYYHNFKKGTTVQVEDTAFSAEMKRNWVGLSLGGTRNFRDDNLSIYGELGAKSSTQNFGSKNRELSGELGLRINF